MALNEQFMVAVLTPQSGLDSTPEHQPETKNRVLRVLMTRLGSSKTFGENMIFMLNRARTLTLLHARSMLVTHKH